jgi:transcription antitermination factor NusG
MEQYPWYPIRVRSNFEQAVSGSLRGKGYETYVPVYRKLGSPNPRTRNIDFPLFPGYVFCRIDLLHRLPVVMTPGVVHVVSFGGAFVPVPETELEAIREVILSGLPCVPWPYLAKGQTVRIEYGSMTGVEGRLIQARGQLRIVLSIEMLQRSVSVEIDRSWVRPVGPSPCAEIEATVC